VGRKVYPPAVNISSVTGRVLVPSPKSSAQRKALLLLVSLIVFIYPVTQEVENALGKGALFRLFFKRPAPEAIQRSWSACPPRVVATAIHR
jgi:hypothetical protein